MDTTKYAVNEQSALDTITVFLHTAAVIDVEVFGSVSRDFRGNDLDLIIVVDRIRYASFVKAMSDWTHGIADENLDVYCNFKGERYDAALKILGIEGGQLAWLNLASRGLDLDLHLLPQGWKKHLEEIQSHLPHSDPAFMRNIAHDAVTPIRSNYMGYVRANAIRRLREDEEADWNDEDYSPNEW